MSMRSVTVRIPATSANLGPGFDCLALALNLQNEVRLEAADDGFEVSMEGEGLGTLPANEHNRILRAAGTVYQKAGRPFTGLRVHAINRIPISSGMGSSAAAAVGGLVGANALLGNPLDTAALMRLAAEMEGHADNAAAAFLGGLVIVATEDDRILWRRNSLPAGSVVVVVPEYHVSTAESRAILPDSIHRNDATFNMSHALLTADALRCADYKLLSVAMQDRLHQPMRLKLFPYAAAMMQAARDAGAASVAISGAGPGIIAFAEDRHEIVLEAMQNSVRRNGIPSKGYILEFCNQGVVTEMEK